MIPLSLAYLSELAVPPLALVELAAQAGFASIGLRMMAAAPGGIEYRLRAPQEQAALRRRCADTGVTILYGEMGFMAALPPGIPLGVELPIAVRFPDLAPAARARLMAACTQAFLTHASSP